MFSLYCCNNILDFQRMSWLGRFKQFVFMKLSFICLESKASRRKNFHGLRG